MTKEDFTILRNSITMRQVAESYHFKIIRRGSTYFTICPFHNDKNASMQVFEGYRGFYCRGCGTGGDVTRFVELYANVTPSESAMILSERFGVPISENGDIPLEVRERASKAQQRHEQQVIQQEQVRADLMEFSSYIEAYRQLIIESEPFSEVWMYCQNELPKAIGNWEEKFKELKKL